MLCRPIAEERCGRWRREPCDREDVDPERVGCQMPYLVNEDVHLAVREDALVNRNSRHLLWYQILDLCPIESAIAARSAGGATSGERIGLPAHQSSSHAIAKGRAGRSTINDGLSSGPLEQAMTTNHPSKAPASRGSQGSPKALATIRATSEDRVNQRKLCKRAPAGRT